MVIRTGSATLEVDSLELATERVRVLAARLGGFVGSTSLQTGRRAVRSAQLEVRVPADRFDAAVQGLAAVGRVESVHVSAQDVGEEFVDVQARVANARRLEERLIELLERRTGSLEDVLAVERELARVREEIERYEGRLRYLGSRVATSTLQVHVHEPMPLFTERPGHNPIRDAFRQMRRNFVEFVAGLIASLGVVVPALLLAALALVVLRVLWRRLGRRRGRDPS